MVLSSSLLILYKTKDTKYLFSDIKKMLKPFTEMVENKQLDVVYVEYERFGNMPSISCDWKIYNHILFQIFYNSVKYSLLAGRINITIGYDREVITE